MLFYHDVHVHLCHHLARVGRGTVGGRGVGWGHCGGEWKLWLRRTLGGGKMGVVVEDWLGWWGLWWIIDG